MKRSAIILFVDVISFVGFVLLTSTGVLLHYLLPPGSGRWSSIWGLSRHEWGDIHFVISVAFFCMLSLHLIIHWRVLMNWVRGRRQEGARMRLALGIVGMLVILILAVAPLLSPTNVEDKVGGAGWRHKPNTNIR